jgi:hypothetical protein
VSLENNMNQHSQSYTTQDCGPPGIVNLPESWIDEADSFYTGAPAASLGFAVLGCFVKMSLNSMNHDCSDESAGVNPATGIGPLRGHTGSMPLFARTSCAALAVVVILIVYLL